MPSAKNQVTSSNFQAYMLYDKYQVPSLKYQVPSAKYQVTSNKFQSFMLYAKYQDTSGQVFAALWSMTSSILHCSETSKEQLSIKQIQLEWDPE